MAEAQSLLSLIARGYAAGREDAATEALCFIVSRSDSARAALAEFLGFDEDPLPIASFRTQFLTDGAFPDMVCLDKCNNRVAFIESKFWATLTHNQPVKYWEELAANRPSVLLFLAPASRVADIDEGSLWGGLVRRLRCADHDLDPVDCQESRSFITAPSKDGQRRLILASWDMLLDRLTQRTVKDADFKACFEIAELRGLAHDTIQNDDPVRDKNLKRSIADAVTRLKESGWVNTDGLTVGSGSTYYARFFRLAGGIAGLLIDYKDEKQLPDRSLWLRFGNEENGRLSADDVACRLGQAGESEWERRDQYVYLPIVLPAGADSQAPGDTIVAELERIAKIIDPKGPTYLLE